jgi:hypothetical protein
MNPLSAKASLAIGLDARGSQQLVVLLGLSALSSLAVGFFFLWFTHPYTYIPFICSAGLVAASIYCHRKSQPMLDLAAAGATKLTNSATGMHVETSALTLSNPEAAATLERLVTNLAHRQPLPPPDGTTDASVTADQSDSAKLVAAKQVDSVNNKAQELHKATIAAISGHSVATEVELPPVPPPPQLPPKGINELVSN